MYLFEEELKLVWLSILELTLNRMFMFRSQLLHKVDRISAHYQHVEENLSQNGDVHRE